MLLWEVSDIRGEHCYIGLKRASSIPLLCYDTLFSMYMTVLFLMPLLKHKDKEGEDSALVMRTLRRNLVAATVSTSVSFANILSLALFYHGIKNHTCWSCCMVDVLINSLVVCPQ